MANYFSDKLVTTLLLKLVPLILLSYNEVWAGVNFYEHRRFTEVTRCPGQVISETARYQSVTSRSVLECVSLCRPDTECVSIVFEVDTNTCHLASSRVKDDCSNAVPGCETCRSYEKVPDIVCENGGTRGADGQSCTCALGYYGHNCTITVADCEEYIEKGFYVPGLLKVIFLKPAGVTSPFPVACDRPAKLGNVRTQVAFRGDPAANFNLTWPDYKGGFGDPLNATYWLGLEGLHLLTANRKYTLRIRVEASNGILYFQHYNNFVVEDEAKGYAFSISSLIPNKNLGDCLSELVGARFSTYDADNDGSAARHCAVEHGGGWWFKGDNCSSCNPFGPILPLHNGTRKGVIGESFWVRNLGDIIPFTFRVYLVAGEIGLIG